MTFTIAGRLCLYAFVFSLTFNITQINILIGIQAITPIVSLGVLILMAPFFFLRRPLTLGLFITYLFPVLAILAGVITNFIINSIQSGQFSSNIATVFPYIYAITFSYYIGTNKALLEKILNIFVTSMTIFSALAIIDILAILLGFYSPVSFLGGSEQYAKGLFSFYGILTDGTVYPRLYGVFAEPGHYAMYLIPVIIHNILTRKVIFLGINFFCFIATFSLGGYISLLFAISLMILFSSSYKLRLIHLFYLLLFIVFTFFAFEYLISYYIRKGESAGLREDNVILFFINFKDMLYQYPLGYPYFDSIEQLKLQESFVVSTNFSLFNIYLQGGLISLIGYLMIIFMALYYTILHHRNQDIFIRVFCITVPAFILFMVQRTTPFDTYYFPFLIAPFLVYFSLSKKNV